MDNEVLLDIQDLRIAFPLDEGNVQAVQSVSLMVRRGEILGVVGESGCGKSISALSLLKLIPIPPGRIVSGEVILEGQDLLQAGDLKNAEKKDVAENGH